MCVCVCVCVVCVCVCARAGYGTRSGIQQYSRTSTSLTARATKASQGRQSGIHRVSQDRVYTLYMTENFGDFPAINTV